MVGAREGHWTQKEHPSNQPALSSKKQMNVRIWVTVGHLGICWASFLSFSPVGKGWSRYKGWLWCRFDLIRGIRRGKGPPQALGVHLGAGDERLEDFGGAVGAPDVMRFNKSFTLKHLKELRVWLWKLDEEGRGIADLVVVQWLWTWDYELK